MAKPRSEDILQLQRLNAGGSFDDFELHDGRVDLRNETISDPQIINLREVGRHRVGKLSPVPRVRKVDLRNLDLSGSLMRHLRISQSGFVNCRFDRTDCRGWSVWSTTWDRCTFVSADLSESSLGGIVPDGTQNHYNSVEFIRTDMRHVICDGAVFSKCLFDNVKWDGAAIGMSSSFVDCTFRGEIRDVAFGEEVLIADDQRQLYGQLPVGRMRNVDFREAVLRDVTIRMGDLQDVKWPSQNGQLVITNFRLAIDRVLARSPNGRADLDVTRRYFELLQESLGPADQVGVFYEPDLIETLGPEEAKRVTGILVEDQGAISRS